VRRYGKLQRDLVAHLAAGVRLARIAVSPFIIVVGAYLLVAILVVIGVVGFNPGAIRPLIRAPRHVPRLLVSRRMRQNHALEHATLHVIATRYRRTAVIGMPAHDGFHVRGRVPPEVVTRASREALRRLKRGERQIAISRRCPTSLIAAQMLLAVVGTAGLYLLDLLTPPPFMLVLIGAALLGPPLSPLLQRLVLIDPDVESLTIRDIEIEQPTGRLAIFSFLFLSPVFVRTGPARRSEEESGEGDVVLITRDQQEIPAGRYRVRK
jgi:hypothetical protein